MRDDHPLIQTRDDLLELIAHALRLQLTYLSKDQALAVADTILRTLKDRTVIDPAVQIMLPARGSGVLATAAQDPAELLLASRVLHNHSRFSCRFDTRLFYDFTQSINVLPVPRSAESNSQHYYQSSSDCPHYQQVGE